MRGQSKDHATLQKLCSKFHWLSVPPTGFNVRLIRQRQHNLPRAMQVKARICRQSCHNLNIQRQYQMQNCFGMLLHAPDSHGEIEALLLEVLRCQGSCGQTLQSTTAKSVPIGQSAVAGVGDGRLSVVQPAQSRPRASSSFFGRPAASA